MIVRIVWGRLKPNAWPSVEQIFRRYDAASTPGLSARIVTQDVNDPESMYSIAFWSDRPSLERWLASDVYRLGFSEALRPFLASSQSVSMADVRVEDLAGLMTGQGLPAPAVQPLE
jgi:heme-degrading monooxygenase HmoA